MPELVITETDDVGSSRLAEVRLLCHVAFEGDFDDDDWNHGLGGVHVMIVDGARVLSHAALVARHLVADTTGWSTGYVEAVATMPDHQGSGLGTRVMETVGDLIRNRYELGALGTGDHHFYERLGWERWRGPTYVDRGTTEPDRSAEDDDGVMVLRFGPTTGLDRTTRLVCEARAGDDW